MGSSFPNLTTKQGVTQRQTHPVGATLWALSDDTRKRWRKVCNRVKLENTSEFRIFALFLPVFTQFDHEARGAAMSNSPNKGNFLSSIWWHQKTMKKKCAVWWESWKISRFCKMFWKFGAVRCHGRSKISENVKMKLLRFLWRMKILTLPGFGVFFLY